jgi:hypothetical protein
LQCCLRRQTCSWLAEGCRVFPCTSTGSSSRHRQLHVVLAAHCTLCSLWVLVLLQDMLMLVPALLACCAAWGACPQGLLIHCSLLHQMDRGGCSVCSFQARAHQLVGVYMH